MRNKTKNWIILIGLALFGLGLSALRPVPIPEEEECIVVKAVVAEIYEDGDKDIVFRLQDQEKIFYINRGLEVLIVKDLKTKLIDEEVRIKYPKYWTVLDPTNSVRHISQLEYAGEIIFTEMD